jgi:hypothetical protein
LTRYLYHGVVYYSKVSSYPLLGILAAMIQHNKLTRVCIRYYLVGYPYIVVCPKTARGDVRALMRIGDRWFRRVTEEFPIMP